MKTVLFETPVEYYMQKNELWDWLVRAVNIFIYRLFPYILFSWLFKRFYIVSSFSNLVAMGKRVTFKRRNLVNHLDPVIKVNITNIGTDWHHVLPNKIGWIHNFSSQVSLPKMHKLSLIVIKHQKKKKNPTKLRYILQSNWPVFV